MGLVERKPDYVACEQQRCRPALHLFSLIGTFIICSYESIVVKFSACKISLLWLVSLVEQADLSLIW